MNDAELQCRDGVIAPGVSLCSSDLHNSARREAGHLYSVSMWRAGSHLLILEVNGDSLSLQVPVDVLV